MDQHNCKDSQFAVVVFNWILIILIIPAGAILANGALGGGDSLGDQIGQILTVTALFCLMVIALAVVISRGMNVYFEREIARMRAITQAYDSVRQDYEWKNKLYHRDHYHPTLPPTEIDPAIWHIEPLVPLKRRVKQPQDKLG